MPKFYTYIQNNSGGSFIVNDDVCEYVIIEADNYEHANWLAEKKYGIYFDECNQGLDCSYCGDRWNKQWNNNYATDVPMIYGKPLSEVEKSYYRKNCIVYYLDGRKELIDLK
ncbi:DUF7296 family protein [Paenibacillus naphthalenovorans]|uniref:DUF7296 domain-containing protein n=1 Tax=Paenibacillus naphthalenovorans TaxID=162209 RepID=A0A0U2W0S0_9BACL|nr:hypothetical protein [Paenibacillus naphthalenovorans]ALS22116.1 hypothetical protein IJ22_17420 [Paenibacillus naphthalenovorans]